MDAFWESLLKREREFTASAKPEFRHGSPFVGVSTLAEQFYCEYKVENEFALGRVETEAKTRGTEMHEALVPVEEISTEEFVRRIRGRKPSYAVLSAWGAVAGLRLIGTPDHIVWADGKPLWLVELKTTRGDPVPLWDVQANQAWVFGLLLDLLGFDCSKLGVAVARVRVDGLSDGEKARWAREVSEALLEGRVEKLESGFGGAMKVHVLKHDRRLAVAAVTAKRGYWTGEREPTSSTSVGKCRACEYGADCQKSLVRPA